MLSFAYTAMRVEVVPKKVQMPTEESMEQKTVKTAVNPRPYLLRTIWNLPTEKEM